MAHVKATISTEALYAQSGLAELLSSGFVRIHPTRYSSPPMNETVKSIIDRVTVEFSKPTRLASGHICTTFFDCVRLTPSELARLAAEATGHLEEDFFDIALGIAYSGIFFAAAVAGGRNAAILQADGKISGPDLRGQRVVVATDVVCSGAQIQTGALAAEKAGASVVGYACIVDRSEGKFGSSERPLWSAYQTSLG